MRPLARRLQAVALALMFLGGGTGVPGLDVLLFHLHGEESRATAHVEPADGCSSHAGHCPLGYPAGAASALGTQIGRPLLAPATSHIVPSLTWLPVPRARGVGFQSRAPPVSHA